MGTARGQPNRTGDPALAAPTASDADGAGLAVTKVKVLEWFSLTGKKLALIIHGRPSTAYWLPGDRPGVHDRTTPNHGYSTL